MKYFSKYTRTYAIHCFTCLKIQIEQYSLYLWINVCVGPHVVGGIKVGRISTRNLYSKAS